MRAYYLFHTRISPNDAEIELSTHKLDRIQDKDAYLKAAYNVITTRYESSRIKTVSRLFDLFSSGVEDIWNRSGFLHCTNQNYLLTLLLIKSGHFKSEDIKPRWTLVWYFMPHQYLRIQTSSDTWVNVDCWGRHYGVQYGNYARGFNMSLLKSFVTR